VKYVTFRTSDGTRAGIVEGDLVSELPVPDIGTLLREGLPSAAPRGSRTHELASLDLAPPVSRPGKIICLGLNYRAHALETSYEVPKYPTLFAKFAEALIGAREAISMPPGSDQVDWEVELAFVVGRRVRNASDREAREAIAGFTVLNDISMRDWQNRTTQWLQGKTFEAATPVGPVVVTPDEVDGAADLNIRCEVDGEEVQNASTSDLLFGPVEVVRYISEIITLEPGDLISTGTPSGVGMSRVPPIFLKSGQVLTSTIEGIGELVNPCVDESVLAGGPDYVAVG